VFIDDIGQNIVFWGDVGYLTLVLGSPAASGRRGEAGKAPAPARNYQEAIRVRANFSRFPFVMADPTPPYSALPMLYSDKAASSYEIFCKEDFGLCGKALVEHGSQYPGKGNHFLLLGL